MSSRIAHVVSRMSRLGTGLCLQALAESLVELGGHALRMQKAEGLHSMVRWLHGSLYFCALVFIAILEVAAWMEPPIHTLHFFQALIYVGIIALCGQRNVFGYGAAIGIAAFWNTANLFATTFIKAGVEEY